MDHLIIQTDGGPLSVVGRIHAGRSRPSLLAVAGAFPPKDHLHDLVNRFYGVNVLIVNLPGMAGGYWATRPKLEGLTRGLESAADRLLADGPIVACGLSTGNLLSLGLRLPRICHRVAIEPFFQTKDLWPFVVDARERIALNPGLDPMPTFFWELFGIGMDRLENRDYRYLLDAITVPTDVIVGHTPLLPQRPLDGWPSFTSADDRAALRANPLVTLHEGPAGSGHTHGTKPPSYEATVTLLHKALRAAVGQSA